MRIVRKRRSKPSSAFNMAPMIDVVFLLIIFFVLVSTFASAELIPMEVPAPDNSQAVNKKLPDRVIINVQHIGSDKGELETAVYSIGPNRPESLASIAERLELHKRVVPDVKVVIRADRRVNYGDVREVMEIIAETGIEMMNIVAYTDKSGIEP